MLIGERHDKGEGEGCIRLMDRLRARLKLHRKCVLGVKSQGQSKG